MGSVIGHELFSGVLSATAATDFRTFLEFGPPGLVGFDAAYVRLSSMANSKPPWGFEVMHCFIALFRSC